MSYAATATLALLVAVAAVVMVVAIATTLGDVIGGTIVVAALVVFMRAFMRLAGESVEQPPPSDRTPGGRSPLG
jgi:hypothetical protein